MLVHVTSKLQCCVPRELLLVCHHHCLSLLKKSTVSVIGCVCIVKQLLDNYMHLHDMLYSYIDMHCKHIHVRVCQHTTINVLTTAVIELL